MTPKAERMLLCALQVSGVPRIGVEEALWIAAEILLYSSPTRTRGRSVPELVDTRARVLPLVPRTRPDERAARRSLLDQVSRLEAELASLFCSTWPRKGFEWDVPGRGGPAPALARPSSRSSATTWPPACSTAAAPSPTAPTSRSSNRRLIEEMLLEPERHKWTRVSNEDIGEPGCKHWHVRPRMGVIGMLTAGGTWSISSGCPLAT